MMDKLNECIFLILFLIIFIDLLEKYSSIWDKVSTGIEKEWDNELVHNKKYFKNQNKIS